MSMGIEQDPFITIEQKPHHNCGVLGIVLDPSAQPEMMAEYLASGLSDMQNRGDDSAGIAILTSEISMGYADFGKVKDILTPNNISGLPAGLIGLGHNRYRTKGKRDEQHDYAVVSPFQTVGANGKVFWTSHNGQFNNSPVIPTDTRGFAVTKVAPNYETTLEDAVLSSLPSEVGSAYSIIFADESELLAFCDPVGFHPVVYGYSEEIKGWITASETPTLYNLGVERIENLREGHMLRLMPGQDPQVRNFMETLHKKKLCVLEPKYFARADGELEGQPIFEMRKNFGRELAKSEENIIEDAIVMAVPDSSRGAAEGFAEEIELILQEGFVRATSSRSFQQSTQASRSNAANKKLQPISSQMSGKEIYLIEDSLIRGTTMVVVVNKLKSKGVKAIHLRIAAPPSKYRCHYGIDMPNEDELIANKMSLDEIKEFIGLEEQDTIRYSDIEASRRAVGGELGRNACAECFTGQKVKYPTDFIKVGNGEMVDKQKDPDLGLFELIKV